MAIEHIRQVYQNAPRKIHFYKECFKMKESTIKWIKAAAIRAVKP